MPVFNSDLSARSVLSCQTDFGNNRFLLAGVGVYGIRIGPRHSLSINTYYKNVGIDNELKMNALSLEFLWSRFYLFNCRFQLFEY